MLFPRFREQKKMAVPLLWTSNNILSVVKHRQKTRNQFVLGKVGKIPPSGLFEQGEKERIGKRGEGETRRGRDSERPRFWTTPCWTT